MAEYESVQQAEAAAGNKAREISEAVIRLLQQRQKQARERGVENEKTAQSYEPSQADEKFFQDLYQGYRDRGVDRETARAAAADITLGLGASESGMIQQAELQVVNKARLAEEYRATAQTAISPDSSLTEKQQAIARKHDLERSLGIHDQPIENKVKTINQLDPKSRAIQPIIQTESAQASSSPEGRETLRQNYQDTLEKRGARRETAKAASQDLVAGKGAADSPPIALAEREIERHQVIQDMYQGVYEKNGVSPEVAAKAADQLARGKGANRSTEVRQAHDQALANISRAQQTSTMQAPQSTTEQSVTHSTASQQPENLLQKETPRPISRDEKMGFSEREALPTPKATKQPESKAIPIIEEPPPNSMMANAFRSNQEAPRTVPEAQTSDTLWQRHSPTEQGEGRPDINYEQDSQANTQRFAYNALAVGTDKKDVKQSILLNSSVAQESGNAAQYADSVIERAEQVITTTREQPAQATANANNTTVKEQPQPVTAQQNNSEKAAASTQREAEAPRTTASVELPEQKLTAKEIYDTFGNANKSGVAAQLAKQDPKMNDLSVAQNALAAGHSPNNIEMAIAEQSSHAKSLKGPDTYAKRTVQKAQKAFGNDSESADVKQGQKAEKGQASDLARDKPSNSQKANKEENQASKLNKSRKSTQKKSKRLVKSQGQGPDL